jgi:hypothetical protein
MSAARARVAAKLDRLALEQLRTVAARLAEENEELRRQLAWAEDAAESWRDDALKLMEDHCAATGDAPGLTLDGRLVAVQGAAGDAYAARYRWLRDMSNGAPRKTPTVYSAVWSSTRDRGDCAAHVLCGADLDAAIDAAIAASEPTPCAR